MANRVKLHQRQLQSTKEEKNQLNRRRRVTQVLPNLDSNHPVSILRLPLENLEATTITTAIVHRRRLLHPPTPSLQVRQNRREQQRTQQS